MFRILLDSLFVVACYKWGDWKNWKEYYPTILYAVIGNLSYNYIFYEHSLWQYKGLVSHTFSEYLSILTVYPSAIILFFSYYPDKLWKQAFYIAFWTGISTCVEFISYLIGYFTYTNGWNTLWSMGLLFIGFILLRFHLKNPLLVWPVSGVFALLTMLLFNIPLGGYK